MAKLTEKDMYYYSQLIFLPIMLLINFALFQYLFVMYFSRRKELRGMLLLGSAVLGFVSLIPLAHKDEEMVHHLNDISEACSTLTFLIQITIIGRDTNRKVKIHTLYLLTLVSEVMIVAELAVILLDIIELFNPSIGVGISKEANQIVEDVSLVFIFVFRFYYLSLLKGFSCVLTTKRAEIFVYLLFLTHEYPFMALESTTGVTWEFVQGVYHRLTIVGCIWITVRNKLKNGVLQNTTKSSNQSKVSRASRRSITGDTDKSVTTRGATLTLSGAAVAPATGPTLQLSKV